VTAPLQPNIRFTLRLEKVPASEGTTVYRWATKPLADAGAWAEGRLLSVGAIERSLSTPDGDYDIATCDLMFEDPDGLIRGLLAGQTTRYFTSREAAVELLSDTGRTSALAWRALTRGRVTDAQAVLGRKAKIRIADEVGSHFSGFDLDKTLGVRITRREHPNASSDTVNRIYPIVIGEHSDIGATDENGNAADKGLLPVIDVGDYLLTDDGADAPADAEPAYLAAPANLLATVNGTPGTTSYTYGVTAISPYGETTATIVTVTNGPASLNGTDNITLTWDEDPGAIEFRVYGRTAPDAPVRRLAVLNNDETWADPETEYEDDGSDAEAGGGPPSTNTAQVDQVLTSGQAAFGWARLITKIGANSEVHHVYASDLATGTAPKRVRMTEDVYGSEFLVYGRAGWPHDDPWIEINGIRMGVIYARGPRLKHHRDRTVTITWNGCGDDDIGDGTGDTIDEAFPALQHVLNEYVLRDEGAGYLTGDFGPLEEYSNGVAKLKTSAFAACQTLTVTWIGDRGYLAAFAIVDAISLRDFLRKFAVTFASYHATNHHGQYYPVLIDDTASATAGRIYRDSIEAIKAVSSDIDHDAVETRVTYHFDYNTEAQKFRNTDLVIEDTVASDAHKGVRERGVRQCFFTRDEATAMDSNARHLARYKVAPHRFGIETDLTGLEDELGAQIRIQHYDDLLAGASAVPYLVVKHKPNLTAPETVTLTGFDLSRILATGFPLLATKASGAVLYDKDTFAPPPSGAYELR